MTAASSRSSEEEADAVEATILGYRAALFVAVDSALLGLLAAITLLRSPTGRTHIGELASGSPEGVT